MTSKREQLLDEIESSMNVADMWWDMWQDSKETDSKAYDYWMQDNYKVKGLCDAYKIVYGKRLRSKEAVEFERCNLK